MQILTEQERDHAAAALDQVLELVATGQLEATAGQASYIAGAVAGLRGALDGKIDLNRL